MGEKKWVLLALVTGLLSIAILLGLLGYANSIRLSRTDSIPSSSATKTVVVLTPTYSIRRETGLYASAREEGDPIRWLNENTSVKPANGAPSLDCIQVLTEGIQIELCNIEVLGTGETGWVIKHTMANTPELTILSTPEPTISDSDDSRHLDYSDVINLFLETGISCNEWEFGDDGYYRQDCLGTIDDGIIQGGIAGKYENTVAMYFFIVVPYTGSDITEYSEKAFSAMLDFGDSSLDMQSWVVNNIEEVAESETMDISKEFSDARLELSGGSGVVSLVVILDP